MCRYLNILVSFVKIFVEKIKQRPFQKNTMIKKTFHPTLFSCLTALPLLVPSILFAEPAQLRDWPHITSAIAKDPALETRIAQILASMNLQQKLGQMTQPEIKTITPAQVTQYYIGSVLNGGGSWPNGNKYASAADWVALADKYYAASMATDMEVKIPVIWGIDAIHGNSNVYGATLFPHNIGLGATHNKILVGKIASEVGKAVRATGISWVFAPTIAVVQDDRWGRTYESFSEDATLVNEYAATYVTGLQGDFARDDNVIATAKHFLGDGGTDQGKDQGINLSSKAQMINVHAQGYFSALAAGAQTVMTSYNSWNDITAGINYGKMHGSKAIVTDILKTKMGFDGFVISDWNAIGQIPGCSNASCPEAVNAGVDMFMVPDDWQAFITNTMAQVKSGQIPMARIDDAVTRILRVKLRAGLFGKKPSNNVYAGKPEALLARELARKAVRESLVLLKNNDNILPLNRGKKILVVGKNADSMSNQTGGWSLTWQGTDNKNSDFPNGDTILAGIIEAAGAANVSYSVNAAGVDLSNFDVVIAVVGEMPYAEGNGDIGPSGTLRLSGAYPEDLSVLQAVSGKGKPVITVLLSGRPLYVNDLLNLSNSFVAAWLPGTEGKGIADVLFKSSSNKIAYDFSGTLSFSWPKSVCQAVLNKGDQQYKPLFRLGYGLKYGSRSTVAKLKTDFIQGGCGVSASFPVFNQADRASFPLYISSGSLRVPLGSNLNTSLNLPTVKVEISQINMQQDAKSVTWTGAARIEAHSSQTVALPAYAIKDGVLQFDTIVSIAPSATVLITMECGNGCAASFNATSAFTNLAGKAKQSIKIPLSCFVSKGLNLSKIDTPFSVSSEGNFSAAFTNIQIVGGAAKDLDVLTCNELK
jgi:beta-glucosidase